MAERDSTRDAHGQVEIGMRQPDGSDRLHFLLKTHVHPKSRNGCKHVFPQGGK
jgi:hypothetical protein